MADSHVRENALYTVFTQHSDTCKHNKNKDVSHDPQASNITAVLMSSVYYQSMQPESNGIYLLFPLFFTFFGSRRNSCDSNSSSNSLEQSKGEI